MKRKLLLFLTCLSLMAGVSMARTVRGVVLEAATDEPIAGATVKCKGNPSVGTSTNVNGEFSLNVPDNEKTLVVSFIGMKTKDVAITGDYLTIALDEATLDLDEVVVVGYGTTSKRKTTSSVSVIKASEIESAPVSNLTQSLAGRAAGLIVTQTGGGLNAGAKVSIRGGGTPLYVIDNIVSEQREFQNLNAADIESISVLKDAAGTAIYGQRAGDGIIIVTTKRGQAGKISVDYNFDYSLSSPTELPKKLNSFDAATYWRLGYEYDGEPYPATLSDAAMELYKNGQDPENYANTNWQREVLHRRAPEQRHQLTITGGSERVKAYTALSLFDQSSLYRSDNLTYKRYNARTNVSIDLKEIGLKLNTGLEAYITQFNQPIAGYGTVFIHIQDKWPGQAGKNPLGQPYGGTVENPLRYISDEGGYNKQNDANVRASIDAVWSLPWVKGLSIIGRASYSFLNQRQKIWNKEAPRYDWEGVPGVIDKPSLTKATNFYDYYNTQLLANYNRSFGANNIDLTVGIEATGSNYDNLTAYRKGYIIDVDQLAAGPTEGMTNGGANGAQWRTASVIARAHYDYDYRYLIEFALRHDGSDKFPSKKRWGTFFSGSLGWNLSEEKFWKESQMSTVWNYFKIRSSLGEIGQDSGVGRYAYLSSYSLSQRGIVLGDTFYPTFSEGALPSPDISWYTQRDFNIGFDFGLFNNAFSGSVDYFYKSTKGYLASPSNVGYTAPLGLALPTVKSDGELRRRGLDFTLQYSGRVGDFTYQVGGNFTYFDTRWNINPNEAETSLKNPYQRGTQVADYYGLMYKNLGYFKSAEDVLNSPRLSSITLNGGVLAGDIKYYDYNGDGKVDGSDQLRLGKDRTPLGNYGITASGQWKGLYFNMLWQGATNCSMLLGQGLRGNGCTAYPGPVIYEFQTDIWNPTNTDALYPRPHSGTTYSNNFQTSDFWLVQARYIRLKNLTIGYDFKHKLLKKATWLQKCNVSLSGYNLLTFSPAKKWGLDPEAADYDASGGNYPIGRIYTLSINLGF